MKVGVKHLVAACMLSFLFFSLIPSSAIAATSPTVSLTFYKRWAFALGSDMSGSFTAIASVSSDVIRVEFYLDGQLKLNDSTSPFQWDFDTSNYSLGQHHFEVIAYNSGGKSANDSRYANFVQGPFPPYYGILLFLAAAIPILLFAIFKLVPILRRKEAGGQNA